jgi:hypothetical protein
VASHSPTLLDGSASPLEAGEREPEETESTIHSIPDSLIPCKKISDQAIILPTYIGRSCIDRGESSGITNSKNKQTSQGREYTWSRGLGAEISPIKTRSARKNLIQSTVKISESTPSSSDTGPLRAVKALVREK